MSDTVPVLGPEPEQVTLTITQTNGTVSTRSYLSTTEWATRTITNADGTLAETASIFNELLVTDAALKEEADPQMRLMFIEQKLQQSYGMFCDLYSRYLFEKAFYAEREAGVVSKTRMDELMIAAQKQAMGFQRAKITSAMSTTTNRARNSRE